MDNRVALSMLFVVVAGEEMNYICMLGSLFLNA